MTDLLVDPKNQILRIAVSKEKLAALSGEERVLFLLLGYAANQLTLFQKLLLFSSNATPEQVDEQALSGARTQMLARIAVGLITEAYEVIHKRFLGRVIGREYVEQRLDEGGLAALERLKRLFGKSSLLKTLRSNFAFHHPFDQKVEDAFAAAVADDDLKEHWNWYMANSTLNFFFLFSDMVILHGMAQVTGKENLIEAQKVIMSEVSAALDALIEFINAFMTAVWKKHFGNEFVATVCADISGAPDMEDVVFPVFVQHSPKVH